MQFRKIPLLLFIATLLSQSQAAENPGDRIWTGKNGATFRGVYAETIENGGKIRFFTTDGKMFLVAFGNLIESDQKIILGIEGKAAPGEKKEKLAFNPEAFKELPIADRRLIPERKPEDFGGTDDESLVDALWVSLLWWNAFEVMPVPKTGDFDRKAEWLHKELTRYVAENGGSSATLEETKEGLEKYFSKRLGDIGACQAYIPVHALAPENLSRMSSGNDIVILKMQMTYSTGRSYSVASALEMASPDGSITMHMFGKRLSGKLVEVPGVNADNDKHTMHDGKMVKGKVYEFVLNDRISLPEFYLDNGAKFMINTARWTGALVVKPFVYKTEGKPAPLPEPEK